MSAPLPSHCFDDDSDMESVLSYSETHGTRVAQTVAEKAREKKLKDDPMALVLGPFNVKCRRCHVRIKLSEKSLFDLCHWSTHRRRCLKKPPGTLKRRGPQAKSASPPKRKRRQVVPERHYTPPQKETSIVVTPLPPPADLEPPSSDGITPHVPSHPYVLHFLSDTLSSKAVEEYLLRTNRKKLVTLPISLARQEWNWSQLTPPRFAHLPLSADNDDDADDDDDDDNYSTSGFIAASESDETFWGTPSCQHY
ncbi:hypothetical protein Hypma_008989 [Hypsizygus marmoreus]|uniref:Uncharacterized protein n=1 Tax=Hypsizygus marmoreus TaxID=39966 RepID=A0A369JYA7_HYPMA|nr:hypothetical protein Hypma_008989 [Hypsizygus marmoreus]